MLKPSLFSRQTLLIALPVLLVATFAIAAYTDRIPAYTPREDDLVALYKKDQPTVALFGKTFYLSDLDALPLAQNPSYRNLPKEQRRQILTNALMAEEVFLRAANDRYYQFSRMWREQVNIVLPSLFIRAYSQYLSTQSADMDDVRDYYEKQLVPSYKNQIQYQAAHILVKTKIQATQIINRLKKGEDFTALARAESLDKVSGVKGGDLGWISPDEVVPPFATALKNLEPHHTTQNPVETTFGWHVIRLDDKRPAVAPAFEDVKEALHQQLSQAQYPQMMEALRDKAHVVLFGEDGQKIEGMQQTPTDTTKPVNSAP